MTLGVPDLETLADEACRAARAAGALILASRPQHIEHKPGADSVASQVVTEIDRAAERLILDIIAPLAAEHGHAVLSEEQPDDRRRLETSHFWSIDPLDGTLPFIEGNDGYAVSIALLSRAGAPLIGVVYDPVHDVLYRALAGRGHRREPALASLPAPGEVLSVFVDRSFATSDGRDRVVNALEAIASERGLVGVTLHSGAAAVINACRVLETPPACYVKLPKPAQGGGSLWDFSATACLFHEAGAVATDIHGAALDLGRADSTFMNHRGVLYASDADLAAAIRARLP